MQSVNILSDYGFQMPFLLQLRQRQMSRIGLCLRIQHPVFIKTVKLLRIAHIKAVADNRLRRIVIFHIVQTISAAEIRYITFGRNTRSSEKYHITAVLHP